jgi:acetyl-CoA carboxylase carboxyl transferase subunit alpha
MAEEASSATSEVAAPEQGSESESNPVSNAASNPTSNPTWERVQVARHPKRPHTSDYIRQIFTGFSELHGDRFFGDDAAIVGGFAFLDEKPVMVIGQEKGRDTKQKLHRNFGMPKPEGYRKAMRLMRMADKFGRPIVTFLDTMGAYPGIDAEERGQAEAIAYNLREMSRLGVPVVTIVIGEGGSGGALGMGIANRVYMLENAYYSVISPESCAAIIYRDSGRAAEAAEALRLTAQDLVRLGLIDGVVKEPDGGAHADAGKTAEMVKKTLQSALAELAPLTRQALIDERYDKFRKMGNFFAEGHLAHRHISEGQGA